MVTNEFLGFTLLLRGSKRYSGNPGLPLRRVNDCPISNTFNNALFRENDGTENMYQSHMINLLGNSNLVGGDEVLIRFRLWSDQLTVGWGWAIDNIEVQGNVTSVKSEILKPENIQVFPSPSNGNFDVLLDLEEQNKEFAILIFNIEGKLIYEKTKKTLNHKIKQRIDISNNPSGIYLLKIRSGSKSIYKKILIN